MATANQRTKKILAIYGLLILLAGAFCFLFPDDKELPLPLAALIGPFLAMRLGFVEGFAGALICLGFSAPFAFKPRPLNLLLLSAGIGIWMLIGWLTGLLLYS
ncbi:MAG: hypothetical protein CFE26_17355 [Verrucomicrobiales bacterium VVV1]|nr:MAG: hypothetical protein CFE26_17355 [Verrucomicrobiales bacterium VVV1]